MFNFVVLSQLCWIFMAKEKVYLLKLFLSMSNLFDDTDIDLNFLWDQHYQQVDHLRQYYDTAEFNRELSSNSQNDKTLKILNMKIRSISANGTGTWVLLFLNLMLYVERKRGWTKELNLLIISRIITCSSPVILWEMEEMSGY